MSVHEQPSTKEPVYIIIPVYNRKDLTLKCLEKLKNTGDSQRYSVVVVDDGSTDGTGEAIQKFYPDTIVLPGDGDLWWTGAMALGMDYAYQQGAEYFIWLNDDCLPESDSLPRLLDFARHHPDTIVAPACYNVSESKIDHNGFKGRKSCGATPGQVTEVDGMCGWCVVIPRSVFSKIGPPDAQKFPQYSGDDTYTLRATRAGFSACLVGDIQVKLVGQVRQTHKITSYCQPDKSFSAVINRVFWDKRSPYYLPTKFFYHTEKYGTILGCCLFLVKFLRWNFELVQKQLILPKTNG